MGEDKVNYDVKNFYKGQLIFKEGQIAHLAYLIKSGSVIIYKVINDKQVVLDNLKPGQIFGEMGVISGEPRTANAMASEYSEIIVIDKKTLDHTLQNSSLIIQSLTKSLIDRLKKTTQKIFDKPSDNVFSNVFMGICNILNIMYKTHHNMSPKEASLNPDHQLGLSYEELSTKIKEIIPISQLEIDSVIKKLQKFNLVEINRKSAANLGKQFVKVSNPDTFIKIAKGVCEELQLQGSITSSTQSQEFMDIHDFAKIVNTTPELIYKKIGAGEIPENLFFVHKDAASAWAKELGEEFFKKVKRQRVKIEDLEEINDIVYVDNATLQEAISKIGHYKLSILLKIANEEARDKILRNLSTNIANIVKEEMSFREEVDEIEVADIEDEFINIIKALKGVSK